MAAETHLVAAAPADAVAAGGWKRHGARVASIAMSAALLFGLYRSLDVRLTGEALLRSDPLWLVVSVGLIVPITLLRALRFLWVAPPGALPGLAEATRLTLAASALNVFVPLKAGDLIKSYFVARRSPTSAGSALPRGWSVAIVPLLVLEAAFGTLLLSMRAAAAWKAITARVLTGTGRLRKLRGLADGWPDLLAILRGRRRWILLFSLVLWLVHLCQIWLFTVRLSAPAPFAACLTLAAIALLAGQFPLAAALAVLVSTRNLLPPLLGLPAMRPYLASVVQEARRWQRREAGA